MSFNQFVYNFLILPPFPLWRYQFSSWTSFLMEIVMTEVPSSERYDPESGYSFQNDHDQGDSHIFNIKEV